MIYPYIRHFDFTVTVLKDVRETLPGEWRVILWCLLSLRMVLERTKSYYLFNKLYIDRFCVWIQEVEEGVIKEFCWRVEDIMASQSVTK